MEEESKTFNHDKAGRSDQIALIAELEHIRRHALRSAVVSYTEENDESAIFYMMMAIKARDLRRDFMKKNLGFIGSKDWCLCKSAACLRQLSYEIAGIDANMISEIDSLVDEIWSNALNEDLSDCESCLADKGEA